MLISSGGRLYVCSPDGSLGEVKLTGAGGNGFIVKCPTIQPESAWNMSAVTSEGLHLCWMNDDTVLTVSSSVDSEGPQLIVFQMPEASWMTEKNAEDKASVITRLALPDTPIYITAHPRNGAVAFVQLSNGHVLKVNNKSDSEWSLEPMFTTSAKSAPKSCVKMEVVCCDSPPSPDVRLIRLSAKNRLYVDDVEVLNGATSFHLHSDFLLVTTIQHQLKSLPLSAVFSDNVTKEELWATESVRALERGSRIVASDAQGTKVILQVSYLDIKLRNCSILTRSFVNHI